MASLNDKTRIINKIASMARGSVTLDGREALIVALSADFPTVSTLANPRQSYEYSWEAIERTIDHDGAFKS